MKNDIVKKLNMLNKNFYEKVAKSFDSKRKDSWTGWDEFRIYVEDQKLDINYVLDLGSGNGRLAPLIRDAFSKAKYVGVDQSKELVAIAKERYQDKNTDFVERSIDDYLSLPSESQFDLITMIAVIHHIPGFENRVKLLKKASKLLSKNGIFVVTFWQFMENQKIGDKVQDWKLVGLDEKDLEKNDYLLGWDKQPGIYRYCHYHDDKEIEKLAEEAGLIIAKEYEYTGSSGKLNKTVVFRK